MSDEDMAPEEFDDAFAAGEPVEIVTPVGGPVIRCGPWVLNRQRTWSSSTTNTNLTYRP